MKEAALLSGIKRQIERQETFAHEPGVEMHRAPKLGESVIGHDNDGGLRLLAQNTTHLRIDFSISFEQCIFAAPVNVRGLVDAKEVKEDETLSGFTQHVVPQRKLLACYQVDLLAE